MELRVFDKTVQPLGAIDELASLLWHTKYFDVGTFSLLAPITDNNSRLLVEGNLITKHDEKKEVKTADGGVWRRAAQITYVHITKDENGLEQLEAQGYIENCGNFIYVQGAADDDGSQPVTTVDGEGATGLDLVEVFCDATDIARKYQQGETEVTIPLNTYIAMLKTRGGAELENYGKNINFVSTINTNSNLKFKADFDLGDRITCKETKWGIQIDARITEVTETYQKGEETIEATFGDSLPTLVDQIRKVR